MKSSMQALSAVIVILLGSASASAQVESTSRSIEEKERAALFPSARMIELGRTVAISACASCHNLNGISKIEGEPHLAGQRTVYLYRVLQAYQDGTHTNVPNRHVSYLNEDALLAVSAYYASLSPVRIDVSPAPTASDQTDTSETTQANELSGDDPFIGIRKAMKKCTKCHDETGNSTGSGMPSLTAQDPEYFISSMQSYVDGNRKHKMMKKLAGRLDAATIKDMGVFYAVQKPVRTETQGEGDAKAGRQLSEDCATCHGTDGNAGGKKMPTLAGQDARYFIKAMKAYKDGVRQHDDMFEVADALSSQDFKDLATYYAAQEPLQRDVRTPLNSTEWIYRCERCHGIDGNSSDPRFPMLAGQDKTYLMKAMHEYASEIRINSTMRKMAEPLSTIDIQRIGSHFSSQQPKAVIYMNLPCEDTGTE